MLSWQWPMLFALLPLPLLLRWLLPAKELAGGGIRVPYFSLITQLDQATGKTANSSLIKALLLWASWACLVAAIARPVWVGDPVSLSQERRDLMLAVDISQSMSEQDMLANGQYINRISAVKNVVSEFVEQRSGDRLGLILFGQQAYLQTPLTHDRATVKQQLMEAQLGFAGRATAIGDTIGLAIKRLRDRPSDSRVLILLTDGANSAGSEPLQAAAVAAEVGIRIHTIGVGAKVKTVQDLLGRARKVNLPNKIDEPTLRAIADKTGGQYFRAVDPDDLRGIYREMDRLEPLPEEQTFRPTQSLMHWPVGASLLLSLLLSLLAWRQGDLS